MCKPYTCTLTACRKSPAAGVTNMVTKEYMTQNIIQTGKVQIKNYNASRP